MAAHTSRGHGHAVPAPLVGKCHSVGNSLLGADVPAAGSAAGTASWATLSIVPEPSLQTLESGSSCAASACCQAATASTSDRHSRLACPEQHRTSWCLWRGRLDTGATGRAGSRVQSAVPSTGCSWLSDSNQRRRTMSLECKRGCVYNARAANPFCQGAGGSPFAVHGRAPHVFEAARFLVGREGTTAWTHQVPPSARHVTGCHCLDGAGSESGESRRTVLWDGSRNEAAVGAGQRFCVAAHRRWPHDYAVVSNASQSAHWREGAQKRCAK